MKNNKSRYSNNNGKAVAHICPTFGESHKRRRLSDFCNSVTLSTSELEAKKKLEDKIHAWVANIVDTKVCPRLLHLT